MKNKVGIARILAVNLVGLAITMILTFWIFMENIETLVYNETPYVIFLIPMVAGTLALILSVPFRLFRMVQKYFHVTFMVILAMPMALLLWNTDSVQNAFSNQHQVYEVQHSISIGIRKAETRFGDKAKQFKEAIPDGYLVEDADHPVKDGTRVWMYLLKPTFWRGADEFFACYDLNLNRVSELKTGKQLWDEWYAKRGEPKPFEVAGAGMALHKGIVTYYKKGVGTYQGTLGSDPENKTIYIEKMTLDSSWK